MRQTEDNGDEGENGDNTVQAMTAAKCGLGCYFTMPGQEASDNARVIEKKTPLWVSYPPTRTWPFCNDGDASGSGWHPLSAVGKHG